MCNATLPKPVKAKSKKPVIENKALTCVSDLRRVLK